MHLYLSVQRLVSTQDSACRISDRVVQCIAHKGVADRYNCLNPDHE